jgi:uncharacterized damage-inducible protein DinB
MHRSFEHMAWADRKVLDLLSTSERARQVPGVLRLLSHLIAAERVWLMRLRGEDTAGQLIWPEWDLAQIVSVASENTVGFSEVMSTLSDDADRVVEYRNSQGMAFRTRTADILTHVALHGSYHRGQIAAALRAGGIEPVNTDYITFVRTHP